MLLKDEENIVHPESVLCQAMGSVNDPIGLAGYKYYNQNITGGVKTDIIEISDKRFRNRFSFQKHQLFEFRKEDGFWITSCYDSTTISQHFDESLVSDQFCIRTPDPDIIRVYEEHMNNYEFGTYLNIGEHEWVNKCKDYIDVYIWIEFFEDDFIIHLGKERRYNERLSTYATLPKEVLDSIFDLPDKEVHYKY